MNPSARAVLELEVEELLNHFRGEEPSVREFAEHVRDLDRSYFTPVAHTGTEEVLRGTRLLAQALVGIPRWFVDAAISDLRRTLPQRPTPAMIRVEAESILRSARARLMRAGLLERPPERSNLGPHSNDDRRFGRYEVYTDEEMERRAAYAAQMRREFPDILRPKEDVSHLEGGRKVPRWPKPMTDGEIQALINETGRTYSVERHRELEGVSSPEGVRRARQFLSERKRSEASDR